jgi:hypothetical protein
MDAAAPLPSDDSLRPTFYTVGTIQGGVAPNVVAAHAEAEVLFGSAGPGGHPRGTGAHRAPRRDGRRARGAAGYAARGAGLQAAVFLYTGVPLLEALPCVDGSIVVAHRRRAREIGELEEAVGGYVRIVRHLLA